MNEWLLTAFVALLPVTALATVIQKRPLHAILARGMLGVSAALVYGMLGAPDVALTEALMGTLLTLLLYLVAVRSAMTVKIGWFPGSSDGSISAKGACDRAFESLRSCCHDRGMELELIQFKNRTETTKALFKGRIHGMIVTLGDADKQFLRYSPTPSYKLLTSPDSDWLYAFVKRCMGSGSRDYIVELLSKKK